MSHANLGANVPDAINWNNSGIPTGSEQADLVEGVSNPSTQVGSDHACGHGGNAETTFGEGPQGQMFGPQSPIAAAAIDEIYNYAGPNAVVMERTDFQPIEAVEGFGEPIDGHMMTPMVTQLTK
jgi:hypothetical protein